MAMRGSLDIPETFIGPPLARAVVYPDRLTQPA
jgi:hypothetical protein